MLHRNLPRLSSCHPLNQQCTTLNQVVGLGPLPAGAVPGAGKARVAAGFVPSLVDAQSWLQGGAEKAVASALPSIKYLQALTNPENCSHQLTHVKVCWDTYTAICRRRSVDKLQAAYKTTGVAHSFAQYLHRRAALSSFYANFCKPVRCIAHCLQGGSCIFLEAAILGRVSILHLCSCELSMPWNLHDFNTLIHVGRLEASRLFRYHALCRIFQQSACWPHQVGSQHVQGVFKQGCRSWSFLGLQRCRSHSQW